MPPNFIDTPPMPEHELGQSKENGVLLKSAPQASYNLQIFQSTLNLLAHILIGVVVGVTLFFVFQTDFLSRATRIHIILCVTGYQLLMAQAILSLSSDNGWSSKLRYVDKRRAHWILQILGSGLAIAGSIHKILDKETHWTSYHGQFGLVAFVFTSVSLVNGLASLYSYECRRFLNANISKISHICFGTVAFSAATITLSYGLDKSMFRTWATDAITNTLIAFLAIFSFIIIINPCISFYKKSMAVVRR